jgi:MFS family permease
MSRYAFPSDEDQQPITSVGGHSLYGAHVIVVVFVVSLLATSLLLALGGGRILDWLVFKSGDVLQGEVWRVVTYGLVNPPSLWFIVDMFMIVWFGRELEKFFGRRTFFALYAGLYLVTPVLFTLLGLRWPLVLGGAPGALALFTAFATLYPNVAFFFGILAKWMAAILIGIHALIHLTSHNWPQLLALGATTGFAHLFVRHAQGHFTLPSLPALKRRSTRRSSATEAVPEGIQAGSADEKADVMAEMDALLDRIAKSGIESLTTKERARLEAARESLLKRSKTRR